MPFFPLYISLEDQPVLLVGGGRVALRKAQSLAPFGCRITAAAQAFCPGWEDVDARRLVGRLTGAEPHLWDRPWALVIAASSDAALNHRISAEAQARRIPVNAVDDRAWCTFYFPALVRRGDVVVGVCGAGKAPFYTRRLRAELERAVPAGDGAVLDALESQRPEARRAGAQAADRLIDTLRAALERDPHLTRSQLEELCRAFWREEAP